MRQEMYSPHRRSAGEASDVADCHQLTAALEAAAATAVVGQHEPPLLGWRGIRRAVARRMARVVRLLSGFITVPQTHFNLAALKAMRNMTEQLNRIAVDMRTLDAELARAETTLHRRQLDHDECLAATRGQVAFLERELRRLLVQGASESPSHLGRQGPRVGAQRPPGLEALYASLHSEFRGRRETIKDRVRAYLPFVHAAQAGTRTAPVLDVGCGRGEWLEVLREEGLVGRGVDCNGVVVEECRRRGLEVEVADALAALKREPDASVGAVTALHVIEHLPFDEFVALVDECVRVLRPAGIAIFETPNPENLLVSTYSFFLDPHHGHPLPSPVVDFIAKARGLTQVEVLPLHPPPAAPVADAVPEPLRVALQAALDYAVLARRA